MFGEYLRKNLLQGLRTSPFKVPLKSWLLVPPYAVIALIIGFHVELLRFQLLPVKLMPLLLLTLLIFPALLEEIVFRAILIPRETAARGRRWTMLIVGVSTFLFVVWHPLNALTINPTAAPVFLDPAFLVIVTMLGVTCGYGYVVSGSVWVPVLIHWATVVCWVFFLGGRNLVLEM